jgi:glutathione S-transferase
MYTLHIANKNYSSWSLRPWILLRELGIPFEEVLHRFAEGSNRETFRAFSPNGLVPCLHDDGIRVWDSFAIVEHLAERHPEVWPADAVARAWARSATAEMHSGFGTLRERCTMNCGIRVRLDTIDAALQQDISRIEALWNEGLARFGGPFLAGGHFTAVDAFFAPVAFRVQTYGLVLDDNAAAYAARLRALPAMKAWEAAALAEPWREPGHEAEVRRTGTLLADLRATS